MGLYMGVVHGWCVGGGGGGCNVGVVGLHALKGKQGLHAVPKT